MSSQEHNASLLDLEPDTIIELYELDLGEEEGIYRFHPGKNNLKDIVLSDDFGVPHVYYSLPLEATNFEVKGDGTLPRPKLIISNPQGVLSDAIKRRGDLIGNSIVRKRIFLKFLDNENFPNNLNPFAIPDPQARFDDDIYKINRKTQENKFYIEFELVSPLELENVNVPARIMIANYCPWQYRGNGCLYGKRPDYVSQSITFPDKTAATPAVFFASENPSESLSGPNLGIPIADENNKLFTAEEGYNLKLLWQGDYSNSSSTIVVNGSQNKLSVTLSSAAIQSIVTTQAVASDGDSTISAVCTVDIKSGKSIVFDNGSYFTLSVDATADPDGAAITLTGSLTGDLTEENVRGISPQTISVSSIAGTSLLSGSSINFGEGFVFILDEDSGSNPTSLSGLLSGSLDNGSVGTFIQGVTVDALSDSINSGRRIVFSSGASMQLTSDASASDTTIYGVLSGNLADDEEATEKYLPGDVVRIVSKVDNLSKFGINNEDDVITDKPDRFFVCIKEATADKDPRYEKTYWVADQCSKTLLGCKYRFLFYGQYKNGLPFGGFPAIERYKF